MEMKDKLAVLVPAYNGGELLRESVLSCAAGGLPPDRYALIVVDNCSTDGVPDQLPSHDRNGAPIIVHRNSQNVGRVENWNVAVSIADRMGFGLITFLFVGDRWIADGALRELLQIMERSGAALGITPIIIVEGHEPDPRNGFLAPRVTIGGRDRLLDCTTFLGEAVRIGYIPLSPLQANVYRLQPGRKLWFDPATPMTADIDGSVAFLDAQPGTVVILAAPYLSWRAHSKRYVMSKPILEGMKDNSESVARVSAGTGIAVDWGVANALQVLGGVFRARRFKTWRQRMQCVGDVCRFIAFKRGRVSIVALAKYGVRKVILRREYVSFV